jgi:hypothetical protein
VRSVEVGAVYKPRRGERPLWISCPGHALPARTGRLPGQRSSWLAHRPADRPATPSTAPAPSSSTSTTTRRATTSPSRATPFAPSSSAHGSARHPINNADRKAGHVLLQATDAPDGIERLWGIDHGICFHDPKLRTVIWEFGGLPIPDWLRATCAACAPGSQRRRRNDAPAQRVVERGGARGAAAA